ncbi:hypothetical protein O7635_37135 [Asanoa sp. WMMD1127]|uniref:hypothetical protein n=1 Tax=Asanoa sp. WMMD1127 TaxID=3016107 RepID=UPI002415E97E|nr:hypothetical protein [Asanoa sp. WMMD1127]MDG4827500.1 hypothetical protein [Asanoa sp. WMMD1127]
MFDILGVLCREAKLDCELVSVSPLHDPDGCEVFGEGFVALRILRPAPAVTQFRGDLLKGEIEVGSLVEQVQHEGSSWHPFAGLVAGERGRRVSGQSGNLSQRHPQVGENGLNNELAGLPA